MALHLEPVENLGLTLDFRKVLARIQITQLGKKFPSSFEKSEKSSPFPHISREVIPVDWKTCRLNCILFFSKVDCNCTMSLESSTLVIVGAATLVVAYAGYALLFTNKEHKVLKPDQFQEFPLIQKSVLSHNSAIYRFGLPRSTDVLGLPIGQHISIGCEINGKEIVRSYTPTSTDDAKGYFDLLIKVYENGNVTKFIDGLKIGENIRVRGPKGFFTYTPGMVKEFGMIAGGTGITPMYQIITAIARNPADNTKVHLLYGNVTADDILLKLELDLITKSNPNIKVTYVLNNPPLDWEGESGFVTQEMMEKYLPASSADSKLLLCGPPLMVSAMKKNAVNLGFAKAKPVSKVGDQIFAF